MTPADIDVIIPVHSPTRPVRRAVESVLAHNSARARVLVVAHNTDPAGISLSLGEYAGHEAVETLHLDDGVPSPAGPRNHGLDRATAAYVCLLDSDDWLQPGALDSWLSVATSSGSDVVLARIERQGSDIPDPLPPTRPDRTLKLHAVKDRLAYRSEPVGLISRSRFPALRYTPGLHSGEDLDVSARLAFSRAAIAYDRHGPAYTFGSDAADRVTATLRTLQEDFAFLDTIIASDWYRRLSRRERRVFGAKVFRLHFFDAVLARLTADGGLDAHRAAFADLVSQIRAAAPGALSVLSRRDRAAIDAVLSPEGDAEEVLQLLKARWLGGIDSILTRNPLLTLHRQGPRRTMRDMVA
ncbi:glycosyltransferase family 2 protein [Leucobacter insecticola]|uniref:Glycosyltransferase family 2 protein n=1 Tax=Leucobacter insecticola TaxID=2714934 RepID=A0A6G8FHW3_9MICO|nr:glycosyltransferase family A protein [Leucobacter insecticola]QIM15883.1 glycosyltransferase family 2 protein [Leucobacter insecticola]